MHSRDPLEGTLFEDYDTVIWDFDGVIADTFTKEGTHTGAYATVAPYTLEASNYVKDIEGNYVRLQNGIKQLLKLLDEHDVNMGIVSSGEKDDTPFSAQPTVMLLKKFDIFKYFNYDIILRRQCNKFRYVKPLGKTLFIDDDDENIDEVAQNEEVDVLRRKVFKDWDQLLTKKEAQLNLGLISLGKR
jgi:phosphoglycolate phosphatase-like HAD superfamily hydrolase